jgi:cytoplasmic iron level regulating protein YaaA (DUF328/UPF0246 family)
MLVLLSPAKRLKEVNPKPLTPETTPVFLPDAHAVNNKLRKLSPKKLMVLQGISKTLAEENAQRNQDWGTHKENDAAYYPAVLLFNGDAYLGLNADTLTDDQIEYAQQHLRILSGLYGLLKPLDKIEPYRLEMGTVLKIGRKNNLYEYWSAKVTSQVEYEFPNQTIINLASKEYSKVLDLDKLQNEIIDIEFKDRNKNGAFKVMSFYAKKARGMMARYILQNRIENYQDLIRFDEDGYYFAANESSPSKLVFLRDH